MAHNTESDMRVSATSDPNKVAGAIAGVMRNIGYARVSVIGVGAISQLCKAVAIARGYLVTTGIDLVMTPHFYDIEINGEERTSLVFELLIGSYHGPMPITLPPGVIPYQPRAIPTKEDTYR